MFGTTKRNRVCESSARQPVRSKPQPGCGSSVLAGTSLSCEPGGPPRVLLPFCPFFFFFSPLPLPPVPQPLSLPLCSTAGGWSLAGAFFGEFPSFFDHFPWSSLVSPPCFWAMASFRTVSAGRLPLLQFSSLFGSFSLPLFLPLLGFFFLFAGELL